METVAETTQVQVEALQEVVEDLLGVVAEEVPLVAAAVLLEGAVAGGVLEVYFVKMVRGLRNKNIFETLQKNFSDKYNLREAN